MHSTYRKKITKVNYDANVAKRCCFKIVISETWIVHLTMQDQTQLMDIIPKTNERQIVDKCISSETRV